MPRDKHANKRILHTLSKLLKTRWYWLRYCGGFRNLDSKLQVWNVWSGL